MPLIDVRSGMPHDRELSLMRGVNERRASASARHQLLGIGRGGVGDVAKNPACCVFWRMPPSTISSAPGHSIARDAGGDAVALLVARNRTAWSRRADRSIKLVDAGGRIDTPPPGRPSR